MGVEAWGWGQLNSSGHAISVAVIAQGTLQHHVFVYDSLFKKKSGESIIETQRPFRFRFTRPFNVRFFFLWGYLKSRVYEGKP
jgi:hypothetical protein